MNLMTELDAAEIGGIGEIKRKTLRFDSYRIGTEDGKLTIYAEVTNDIAPKIFTGYPVGQELLLDLINLYEDTKTRTPMGQAQLIIDWCLKNVHPYYLYGDVEDEALDSFKLIDLWNLLVNVVELYSVDVEDMVEDLRRLYDDAMLLFTLRCLMDGKPTEAQRYYSNIHPDDGKNLIGWWQSEKEDAGKRTIIETYTKKLPKLKLALQPGPDGNLMLLPEVNSVIDAAYYALVRFMAVNTGALEDWGGKTTIAFCEGCGRAYIKRGNRQKYCGNKECEAIRNSRKSSRYYYKEKAKT